MLECAPLYEYSQNFQYFTTLLQHIASLHHVSSCCSPNPFPQPIRKATPRIRFDNSQSALDIKHINHTLSNVLPGQGWEKAFNKYLVVGNVVLFATRFHLWLRIIKSLQEYCLAGLDEKASRLQYRKHTEGLHPVTKSSGTGLKQKTTDSTSLIFT